MSDPDFMPGVPAEHVRARLDRAGGKEIESGKFANVESSAALAVNTFGWFVDRPAQLPPFPGLDADFPPTVVDLEYCARFPWAGGRHPWLDAAVETPKLLIGVESKRFEPFRDRKAVSLSDAYDRPCWGDAMTQFERMRDDLRSGAQRFEYLDAAQLVKHAFGLVTDAGRKKKSAVLVYLFAEPKLRNGRLLGRDGFERHRGEIARFANAVEGAAVGFHASSYREWLASWTAASPEVAAHGEAVIARYDP